MWFAVDLAIAYQDHMTLCWSFWLEFKPDFNGCTNVPPTANLFKKLTQNVKKKVWFSAPLTDWKPKLALFCGLSRAGWYSIATHSQCWRKCVFVAFEIGRELLVLQLLKPEHCFWFIPLSSSSYCRLCVWSWCPNLIIDQFDISSSVCGQINVNTRKSQCHTLRAKKKRVILSSSANSFRLSLDEAICSQSRVLIYRFQLVSLLAISKQSLVGLWRSQKIMGSRNRLSIKTVSFPSNSFQSYLTLVIILLVAVQTVSALHLPSPC